MICESTKRVDRLRAAEWRELRENHEHRVDALLDRYAAHRSAERHPVYDFLFEYYSFRRSKLRHWSPGWGVLLEEADASTFLESHGWRTMSNGRMLALESLPASRREGLSAVLDLLIRTAERPPAFGCRGLHEWAMVYEASDVRHHGFPLRMPHATLVHFVNSQRICCTHFDAFRFFSRSARPLNRIQPTKELRRELEQPGCLHANMDLYKWAYKFSPWIASTLIADAFELACDARIVDMRASPYDLSTLGFSAIPIETDAGALEYEREQRRLAERGKPVRARLIHAYQNLAAACIAGHVE